MEEKKEQEQAGQEAGKEAQHGLQIEISRERMLEGVEDAVKQMQMMMRNAKIEYGELYNKKTEYEEFCRRFGTNTEEILQEFDLVRANQSKQPAVIRKVIKQLGDNAFRYCYMMWRKEVSG